ncbi:uncharacterized protein LOC108890199 [Lates japonicus]
MQWTVQITVALLNIVWVGFFLQPHPLSVFVERRSTDSSAEFCIQPPSDMNWTSAVQSVTITANKPNNTNTTSEESEPRNLHEDINLTNMSSPETEQWNETTPVSSPAPDLTSSEVTTASAAAHVRVTHHPKAPVQENENQNQTNHFAAGELVS